MKMYLIGSKSESNNVIFSFADEHNIELTVSSDITSLDKFKSAVQSCLTYDVVILDILDYCLDNKDFEEGIKNLISNYEGIIIIYAPSAAYSDSRITICNEYGINNVIRDFLSMRAKSRLNSIIAPIIAATENEAEITTKESVTDFNYTDNDFKTYVPNISGDDSQTQESENSELQQATQSAPNNFPQSINQNTESNHNIYSSGFENNQDVNQNNTDIRENDKVYVTKKIGIIGVMPRIGTTTQSVLITSFLAELGKPVCYIQCHQSTFIENMKNYFSGAEKDPNKGCIVYEGLDFYSNRNLVHSQNYEYHIYDYGSCTDSTEIPSEFYSNDIRIIVCGGTAEEVARLTSLRNQLYIDNDLIYVFSFIADYEREDIYDLMGEKATHTLFAPYNPDCFKSSEESKRIYMSVFGFNTDKKKRKTKLFRRRRGK